MGERGGNGGIKRHAAARIDLVESCLQLLHAGSEVARRIEIIHVIEIHYEGLVVRVGRFHKGECGGIHGGALVVHTPAVVDHDAHGYGDVSVRKHRKRLLDPVLVNGKVGFAKIVHHVARFIEYGCVQHDEAHIGVQR